MKQPTTIRVLHVGDLHFWAVPVHPRHYLGKRILGIANLLVGGRARRFKLAQAPALVSRLRELEPEYYLFSGDFTTTALPHEFSSAREALRPLVELRPEACFAVPGNHDCYTHSELGATTGCYEFGDTISLEGAFSHRALSDAAHLVRVNAATSNGLGSHGLMTSNHLASIKEAIDEANSSGAEYLLFLCHFPAEDPPQAPIHNRGPQLRGEAAALLSLLGTFKGRVLWLHGHHHWRWIYTSPITANLTYLNAGAPLLSRHGQPPDLGFHELMIGPKELRIVCHARAAGGGDWRSTPVVLPKPGEYVDLQGM